MVLEFGGLDDHSPTALCPLLRTVPARPRPADLVAPLLGTVADNNRAILLRQHLKLAGIDRPRLFEDTATTIRVNFRSLRDSGITWEALAGTEAARIQSRAGHEHIATTLGYIKAVEDLKGRYGTPFGPIPFARGTIAPRTAPSACRSRQVPAKPPRP